MEIFPAVDIVIPHFRRQDLLERCLNSLAATRYPSLKIIVVANGGASESLSALLNRYSNAHLLSLPENRGYAGGCNAGLQHSTAEYVVFLNDDTEHDPFWLRHLVATARADERIAALQPKILSLPQKRAGKKIFDYAGAAGGMLDWLGYPWCLGRTFSAIEPDKGQYDSGQDIFWASGVAMLVRRKIALELGGFDEDFFMQMEEIDLSWRMKLAGYRVFSVPTAIVWHEGGASLAVGSTEKIYYNHRNNIAMLLKNRSLSGLFWLLPLRFLLEVAAAFFYLTQFPDSLKKSVAVFRALGWNLRHLGATLQKRRTIQGSRVVAERTIFRHLPFLHSIKRQI